MGQMLCAAGAAPSYGGYVRRAAMSLCLGMVLVVTGLAPAVGAEVTSSDEIEAASPSETAGPSNLDAEAASAAREAARTGVAEIVAGATSPTELLKAMPDGTMTLELSTVPVRTERSENEWVPIDTDLVLRDGWWEPADSARPVRFSNGGTDVLTQIRTETGEWLSESWSHGTLPIPVVDGRTATYPSVFEDVDLRLTATELGMASVYVVKTPEAAAREELTDLGVELEGADISREPTGAYTAETDSGSSITASSPLWWDSSGGGTAEGPGDTAPAMDVEHTYDEDGIRLDVSATVEGEAPVYPVFIDPDWNSGAHAAWYTDRAYPNTSYLSSGASDVLRMGKYAQYGGNAFFEFNISGLAGKQILGAQLNMTQTSVQANPNSPVQLRLRGHQDAGFTWNQQNHGLWGDVLGTQSPGWWGGPAVGVGWDVASGVRQRVGGEWLQFGLAPQDENAQSRRHFSRAASLTVNYNTAPNTPTNLRFITPSRSCGTDQTQAFISATDVTVGFDQTDPDPGNVDTNVYLYRTGESSPVQQRSPGLGAQGAKSVTFNDLQDGQSYAWVARGSDWMIDGASFSSWCGFQIDRTGPGIPTLTAPSSTPVVGKPSTFTLGTLPADRVAFIAYATMPSASATSFVFDVFNSPPACGSTLGVVRIACPDASGAAQITIAPVDAKSTLLAIPYDDAGNPGVVPGTPSGQAGTVGASYSLTAVNDPLVKLTSGHAWLTQKQTGPLGATVPDTHTSSPVSLSLGRDTLKTLTANPIAPTVAINKPVLAFRDPSTLVLGPGNTYGISTVSTGQGSAELWTCSVGSNVVIGSAATCDQYAPSVARQRAGFTWATAKDVGSTAAAPLWVCNFTGSGTTVRIRAVTNAQCASSGANGTPIEQLGYVLTSTPSGADTTVAAQAIGNLTTSFTVGAWLKPSSGGAAAAMSTKTSAAGFELGATGDRWQFCLRPSASAGPVCASATRPSDATWTHVSGVWDAANGQIRLYVNAALANTVPFGWPADTPTTPQTLYVGSTVSDTTVTGRWSGQLADPATFTGVATASQLSELRSGKDPSNG